MSLMSKKPVQKTVASIVAPMSSIILELDTLASQRSDDIDAIRAQIVGLQDRLAEMEAEKKAANELSKKYSELVQE